LKVPILAILLALGVEAVEEDNVAVPLIPEVAAVLVEVVERTEIVESVGEDEPLVELIIDIGLVRGVEFKDDTALVRPG
jgi:hypothetical protein